MSLLVAGSGRLLHSMQGVVQSCPELSTHFTGFLNQSELADAYAAADIIALPSSTETWGLVVNEAMYFGCVPVVSAMVGCAPDLVEGIGEVHPVGDVNAIITCLDRVINELPERRARVPSRIAQYSLYRAVDGIVEAALRSTGRWQGTSDA